MNSALLVRKFIITLIFLSICKVALADSATLNNGGTTTSQQNIDGNGEILTVSNYSTLNTNRITWPVTPEGESSELSTTCFSAELFKEILVANKDADEGYIEVSSAGLAKVEFTGKDYLSTYYLVQLQAN